MPAAASISTTPPSAAPAPSSPPRAPASSPPPASTRFDADWFTRGLVTFTSGANAGRAQEVKRHTLTGTDATIELWQPMALAIAPGDTFTITAGCDKQFATCRAKFANAVNFRGFPHMPGNDYILAVARPGEPVTTADRCIAGLRGAVYPGSIPPACAGDLHALRLTGSPATAPSCTMPTPAPTSSPSPATGSARPITTRPACAASAPTASAWSAASIATSTAPKPKRAPAYTRDWAEGSGRETLLEAARRHLVEIPPFDAQPGDVLVFRWRRNTLAKHCAILSAPTAMIHALEGAPVTEVALTPWWRRHIAGAFAFPNVSPRAEENACWFRETMVSPLDQSRPVAIE